MQEPARIHRLRADARRAVSDRGPAFGPETPANEDEWPDPHVFERDLRDLFTEEDRAAVLRSSDGARWQPTAREHGRSPLGIAQAGVLALAVSAATAFGIGVTVLVQSRAGDEPGATAVMAREASPMRPADVAPAAGAPSAAQQPVPQNPASAAVAPAPVPVPPGADAPPVAAAPALAMAPATVAPGTVEAVVEPSGDVGAPQAVAPSPAQAETLEESFGPKETLAFELALGDPLMSPDAKSPTIGAVSPGEVTAHFVRATSLLKSGQITAARSVLLLLAEQGHREAAYRYARTFDPEVLASMGVFGVRGDIEIAKRFYGLAAAAGHRPSQRRLAQL